MKIQFPFLLIFLIVTAAACTPQRATPSAGDIQTAIAQTMSVEPTSTPPPVATSLPPSPAPPPAPIHLSSSGDDVIDLQRLPGAALVHIVGNNSGGHLFAVTAFGENGEILDLLVNTNSPYDGVRPLDFYQDQHTTRLEVKATGDWVVDITGIDDGQRVEAPGSFDGSGDNVLILAGKPPDVANIQGNEGAQKFIVTGYGPVMKELVNTNNPYQGKVLLDPLTKIIVVQAQGSWKISLTVK